MFQDIVKFKSSNHSVYHISIFGFNGYLNIKCNSVVYQNRNNVFIDYFNSMISVLPEKGNHYQAIQYIGQ